MIEGRRIHSKDCGLRGLVNWSESVCFLSRRVSFWQEKRGGLKVVLIV